MGSEVNQPAKVSRLRHVFAFAAVLLVGILLGVLADRLYMRAAKPTIDPRLIGRWVHEDGGFVQFREDGTFDSASTTAVNGKVTQEVPYTGPYRWVGQDTIEVYAPMGSKWVTRKLVFEGDRLTLLGDEGVVGRFTRKKE